MSQSGRETRPTGVLAAVVLSVLIALGASLGADQMLPFYSTSFVVGVAAAYYYAVSHGPLPGLLVGSTVLVCFLLQAVGEGGEKLEVALRQLPFLGLFFVGFAALPMALPAILDRETTLLSAEVAELTRKVEQLKQTLLDEHKQRVQDKGSVAKEETVRITSRTTQLTTFLREVLQAASTKEILNLLFSNTTKSYGNVEVGLLLLVQDGAEFLVSRAGHAEHEKLENRRLAATDLPILVGATQKAVPILLPERMPMVPDLDFGMRIVVPVQVEGRCEALLTLGRTRSGEEIGTEDAQFLGTFAELAGEAMAQMKVVLAS